MKTLKERLIEVNQREFTSSIERIRIMSDKSELSRWRFTPHYQKKFDTMTLEELKEVMYKQLKREYNKMFDKDLQQLNDVLACEVEFTSVTITVEYVKSKTWGYCPKATITGGYTRIESSRITGCGYDKESTAIAEALNQFKPLMKLMYEAKERLYNDSTLEKPYGMGYGVLPYFEGGVGVSTYYRIAEFIGCKFESISSGKTFDVYRITKEDKTNEK